MRLNRNGLEFDVNVNVCFNYKYSCVGKYVGNRYLIINKIITPRLGINIFSLCLMYY